MDSQISKNNKHINEKRASILWSDICFRVNRFFARIIRLCGAAALSFFVYWLLCNAKETLIKPLAQTSLLEILGGLVVGGFGIWLIPIVLLVAFGEAQTREEYDLAQQQQKRKVWNLERRQQRTQFFENLGGRLGRLVKKCKR
jgi:hypothetical protein